MVHETSIDPKFFPSTQVDKANWESPNEGVHEKVNFDDTIWGFDLAGGIHYETPLRVTRVKEDSRAEKAGIKKGDTLIKINDVPTETLTLQEAHDMIIDSGIHLRLNVTAPDDFETTYWCWEDTPEYVRKEFNEKKQPSQKRFSRKTVASWTLQFPWVQQEREVYRETNCHMVKSKFETKFAKKLLPVEKFSYYQPIVIKHTEITALDDDGKPIPIEDAYNTVMPRRLECDIFGMECFWK